MDGLEWSVIEPLMEAGRMPHMASLVERGVGGTIQTMVPTFSPVLWTTMATGALPAQHGILNFSQIEADGSLGLPYTSNCRKVPAVWNIVGEYGRSVLSTAWWVSWPAEKVDDGRIVASYAAQAQGRILWKSGVWKDGLPDLTAPSNIQEQVFPLLQEGAPEGPLRAEFNQDFGVLSGDGDLWEFPRSRDTLFRVAYHGDRTHQRIMVEQLREKVADLNMVYIGLPDVAGHYFWRYREPEAFSYRVPAETVAALGTRIDLSYEVADRWLGELLNEVPENTRIVVVSDHGMHAANTGNPKAIQSGAHEDAPDGVFIAAGPGIRKQGLLPPERRRITHILELTPTLLDWLDLPQAEDLPGKSARRLMTAEWVAAHPVTTVDSFTPGFRKATPPRIPGEGLDQEFLEGIREIGYFDSED